MKLERGDRLLQPGVANSHLYLIFDGELRVYLEDRSMPEQAVLGAGDCVGEMSLLDGQAASALVLAARQRTLAIPHDVLGAGDVPTASRATRWRSWPAACAKAIVAVMTRSLEFEQAASVDALTDSTGTGWTPFRAIARCERDGAPLCLVMADIDLFKHFNERFGYLSGAALLRRMARRLADGLRAQDLIARYGGEEFLILLPHTSLDEALPIAGSLRELVAIGCGLPTGEGVTLSCGVAPMLGGESLEALIARADAALKRAKENGRDRGSRGVGPTAVGRITMTL